MLWAVLITYGLIGCSDRRFGGIPSGTGPSAIYRP